MDIAVDKVTDFIDRVRAFDGREAETDPDAGSNGVDDGMTDVLMEGPDDATEQELLSFVAGLNVDEQANLVALVWIGREDFEPEEWDGALRAAHARKEGSTGAYLLGIPNVGDLIEEGLAAMTEEDDLPEGRDRETLEKPPRGRHPELDQTGADDHPEDEDPSI